MFNMLQLCMSYLSTIVLVFELCPLLLEDIASLLPLAIVVLLLLVVAAVVALVV